MGWQFHHVYFRKGLSWSKCLRHRPTDFSLLPAAICLRQPHTSPTEASYSAEGPYSKAPSAPPHRRCLTYNATSTVPNGLDCWKAEDWSSWAAASLAKSHTEHAPGFALAAFLRSSVAGDVGSDTMLGTTKFNS